jgi:hypothetical protein
MREIISEKSKKFTISIGRRNFNDTDYVQKLRSNVDDFRNLTTKITFLSTVVKDLKSQLDGHEKNCVKKADDCHFSNAHRKAIFFTEEELNYYLLYMNYDELNSTDSFTDSEISKLNIKIDNMLSELNKLGLGQEIIFNEIDTMKKNALNLNKKDFKMLLLGKLIGTGFMFLTQNEEIRYELENLLK